MAVVIGAATSFLTPIGHKAEAGVDLVAIQQNLRHAQLETKLGYIGTLGADKRRAPAVNEFDLRKLDRATVPAQLERKR
jgi:hypothetical protein